MTLKARIEVGHLAGQRLEFPAPDVDIEPRALDIAATQLFNNHDLVTRNYIYPTIGFDHVTAKQHAEAEAEANHKAGGTAPPEPEEGNKYYRYLFKGLGLELIVSLLFSCLGAPKTALCPCRAYRDENRGVLPYGPAPAGNPDVRIDYDGFTVLGEVTTIRDMDEVNVRAQCAGAVRHTRMALLKRGGAKRVYCIMVCRLDLHDREGVMQRHLAAAQAKLDWKRPGLAKFIALSIRETGHAGYRLHKLHCRDRPGKALTGQDVDTILANLHGRTMSAIRDGLKIPSAWAGLEFAKLLEEHARGKLIDDLLKQPEPEGGEPDPEDGESEPC